MKWAGWWVVAVVAAMVAAAQATDDAQQRAMSESSALELLTVLGNIWSSLPKSNQSGVAEGSNTPTTTTPKPTPAPTTTTKLPNKKPDRNKQEGLTGFSFEEVMPNSLRALENLDDLLRDTIPRLDQFNCLERLMCEMAAPFQDRGESLSDGLQDLNAGVQTLQQLQNIRPNRHHQFVHPAVGPNQFLDHQQQFLNHQQHQQHLIQQHVQQQQHPQIPQQHHQIPQQHHQIPQQHHQIPQQHHQIPQHPQQPQIQQQPAVPPLPYYIPTPVENAIGRVSQTQQQSYAENEIRRTQEERNTPQYNHQHQQNLNRNNHKELHDRKGVHNNQAVSYHTQVNQGQQYQNTHSFPQHSSQYTSQSSQIHALQQPPHVPQHHHQVHSPNYQTGFQQSQYRPRHHNRPRRRRPNFFQRIMGNQHRRGRRQALDETLNRVGPVRQTKIAPVFQTEDKTLNVRGRSIDSSPIKINSVDDLDIASKIAEINAQLLSDNSKSNSIKSTKKPKVKRKSLKNIELTTEVPVDTLAPVKATDGPSPIKTLSADDVEGIRNRVREFAARFLNSTETTTASTRQARFLRSFLGGWTLESIMKVLDGYMEGYSFHPYTHAAYRGYTSRAGTCGSLYPRCPDSANDMLDFVNNIHSYFPNGIPFRDSLPWPIRMMLP